MTSQPDPGFDRSRRRRRTDDLRARWTPAPSSLTPNTRYRPPGSVGGRRFAPTDHLSTEAVAAYVDGELKMGAHLRAGRHLAACPQCADAVEEQFVARSALRRSADVSVPMDLLGQLNQIPTREIDLRATRTPRPSRESPSTSEDRPSPLSPPGFPVHRRRTR